MHRSWMGVIVVTACSSSTEPTTTTSGVPAPEGQGTESAVAYGDTGSGQTAPGGSRAASGPTSPSASPSSPNTPTTPASPTTPSTPNVGGLFEQPMPWTEDVSALAKSGESDAIIAGLKAAGGWGAGNQFLTDASIEVLEANSSTPRKTFTKTDEFYSPDCDNVPFPVPPGGALEGESGYACNSDGDCHLIVVDRTQKKLFEMWRADIRGTTYQGGCSVAWDLTKSYNRTSLRGRGCTSADAAGFPITAMLASADEVGAGEVKHALRFILPNARIQNGMYVAPATHSTPPTSGGPNTPPYGVRFRLKASVNIASLSPGAAILAKALKKYGMFLSDGGEIALTIQSDRFTQRKWSQFGITDNASLASLRVEDFEVVGMGTRVNWKADTDCTRNP